MFNPRLILIFLASTLISTVSYGQYKVDVGAILGGANYLGEIGGKAKDRRGFILDLQLPKSRTAFGGFVRYKINPSFSARLNVTWGRVSGADNLSENPGRVGRNLSFRNDIIEAALLGEYNFFAQNDIGPGLRHIDFKTYVFAGFGMFKHNPMAQLDGKWIALQPLSTEGQGILPGTNKYKLIEMCIPAGVGLHYTLNRKYRIGFEIGYRTIFTDYIDDISTNYVDPAMLGSEEAMILSNRRGETDSELAAAPATYDPGSKRGDPTHDDAYFFTTFTVSYVLKGKTTFFKSKFDYLTKGKTKGPGTKSKILKRNGFERDKRYHF
jgi:hypothetical protein